MSHVVLLIERHRHLVLLVVLLLLAAVQPIAHRIVWGMFLYDLLMTAGLLVVWLAVFQQRGERRWALLIAGPTALTRWASAGESSEWQRAMSATHHLLVAVFFAFAIVVILRGIFREKRVRTDHFLGTICGYLLAGVAWGNIYTMFDLLSQGAFRVTPEVAAHLSDERLRSFYFNYFSLCALTGAGFGDITPVLPIVSTLSWLEAAFGQFYIAVVVAQLVTLKFTGVEDKALLPSE